MVLFKKLFGFLKYALLIAIAVAISAAAVLTLTVKGRENLAALISDFASTPDRKVTIKGMSGIWSGNFSMDWLVLADAQGPWLVANGVEVEWSPTALLWGRFDAERIATYRVEVVRLPTPTGEAPVEGGSTSLPVDISIYDLDFPAISLGSAVTGGQIASVSANGKAMAEGSPLTVAADVKVSRTDGTPGELQASIDFAPDQNRLEIDLKASEPSGGILANLLKLPGQPAVDLIVTGSGSMANWIGTGTFAVDGKLVTSVSGTHRLTDAGRVVEARGDGEFARFAPPTLRQLLDGKTTFDLAGTLTKDGGVEIRRAQIESGAVTATAVGAFNPAGATDIALNLAAKNGGIELRFGTEQSPIDLVIGQATIRALGDGREPALDISARLPSVSTNDVKLANLGITLHSDAFNLTERSGPVTGSATATSLTIDNPTVAPLVAGEIRAQLEGTLATDALTVAKGMLRSDAIDGRFAGDVSLADGSITLKLDADVVSATLPASVRPLLGDKVALAASLERDTSGNVSANSLTVDSGGLTAKGSARLREDTIDAELSGALADVKPLAPQASGAVALSITAKGSLVAPDVNLTLTSNRLAFGQHAIDGLDLRATGKVDPANPQASVSLKGSLQGEVLEAKAVVATTAGKREVRDLTLSLGPNHVAGALALDDRSMPVGALDFDLPELGRLAALAGQSVVGAAKGTATFSLNGDTPHVKVALASNSIKRGEIEVTAVAVDALVADYLKVPRLSGTVGGTLADLLPGQPPADIRLSVDGTVADMTGNGTVLMEGNAVTGFTLANRLSDEGSAFELKGDGEFARFAPPTLQQLLDGKTTFDLAGTISKTGTVRIDRADLANGALTAGATGAFDPAGPVDLSLQFGGGASGVPLSFGTKESPIDITLGSATVRAVGNADAPKLDIAANLPQVSTNDVKLADLGITLHSDAFNLTERSGPVTGSARPQPDDRQSDRRAVGRRRNPGTTRGDTRDRRTDGRQGHAAQRCDRRPFCRRRFAGRRVDHAKARR